MRIRFFTTSASAHGSFKPGEIGDLPEDFCGPLIEGGYAEAVVDEAEAVIDGDASLEAAVEEAKVEETKVETAPDEDKTESAPAETKVEAPKKAGTAKKKADGAD
jgi:hypothetical protein